MRRNVYLSPLAKKIISFVIVELIPAVVALALTLAFSNFQYFHYIYALWGILIFLYALLRNWRRDTKNYKTNHSIVEDKTTESYKEYKKTQLTLWLTGVANIAISYIFWGIYLLTL